MAKGEKQVINSEELVPGDIVLLSDGNSVPADLRLLEVVNLQVGEMILTGESVPIEKRFVCRLVHVVDFIRLEQLSSGTLPLGIERTWRLCLLLCPRHAKMAVRIMTSF